MNVVAKNFYTLLPPRKKKQLETKGLVAGRRGEIFVFNKLKVGPVSLADHFAVYKFKFDVYLLVTISAKGIQSKPELQPSAGLTEGCEFVIEQKLIDPKFLQISTVQKPDVKQLMTDTFAYGIKVAKKQKAQQR
jgi:hypothetical protein